MQKNIINYISFNIKNILPAVETEVQPEQLTENIFINQYLDKVNEINQLNLQGVGNLTNDVKHIINIDDHNLKALGLACLTGIHGFNGNYKKAVYSINQALELKVNNNVYAYVLTEYGNLLRQLERMDEALAVFERALELTKNEDLKWRIKTYQGYSSRHIDKELTLKKLNQASEYFLQKANFSMYATIQRHLCSINLQYNDFKKAKIHLEKSQSIAKGFSFKSIIWGVRNEIGWYKILEKNYYEATEIFVELTKEDKGPYLDSLVYQNLAYINIELGNYRTAIENSKKSLAITLKNEIYHSLFEDYYRIGLAYEKIGNYKAAEKYLAEGYEKLITERKELGLVLLSGYREKLLDSYVRFLRKQKLVEQVKNHPLTFEFTKAKTYQAILAIFHKSYLLLNRTKARTIKALCEKLEISESLYFVYRRRYNIQKTDTYESLTINEHFRNYLYSLLELNWNQAKLQFDQDLLNYFLGSNKNNKTKVAQLLNVSNLTVIKKTI